MNIAYADPPYIGCAHLYKDHADYAGEVDHSQLVINGGLHEHQFIGMSLRDYFAGKVIDRALSMTESRDGCYDWVAAAACAYGIADAMLEARNSQPERDQ